MSHKNTDIDTIESKLDVVADFLHQQELPYFIVVGIPGTNEFLQRDNMPDGDERVLAVESFRSVTNQALDNLRRVGG